MGSKNFFGNTSGSMIGTVDSLYSGAMVTVYSGGSNVKNLILIACSRVQNADYQLLKALSGDYSINTFGAGPVIMTLKGLQPSKVPTCAGEGSSVNLRAAARTNIESWYASINIGAKSPKVLSVGVNGVAFKGYAYSLTTSPQSASMGGFDYTLNIIAYPMAQSSK